MPGVREGQSETYDKISVRGVSLAGARMAIAWLAWYPDREAEAGKRDRVMIFGNRYPNFRSRPAAGLQQRLKGVFYLVMGRDRQPAEQAVLWAVLTDVACYHDCGVSEPDRGGGKLSLARRPRRVVTIASSASGANLKFLNVICIRA